MYGRYKVNIRKRRSMRQLLYLFRRSQCMQKAIKKSAVSLCEEALGKSMDAELNAQIFICWKQNYILSRGDTNSAADAAAQAVKLDESSNVLRKAAVTAYQAGNEREDRNGQKISGTGRLLHIMRCSVKKNDPSYEDRFGEGRFFFEFSEKYRDSTDVLEEMKIDYPKDYKVQMWICYNYLDEASEEGTYSKCVRRSEIYLSFLQKFI